MNILDLAQKNGRTYKKVSAIHGGEYHGPCPACGGNDRFHIWPEQDTHGSFWCRGCDKGGDAITYLREMEGLSFHEACKVVGKEVAELEEFQKPKFKKPTAETFQPRTLDAPADLWVEHAEKFVNYCHQQLLANDEALAYLEGRGISQETAVAFRLGWNPGEKGNDAYRAREAWGLDTVEKNGKKKKLWLPIGLVIPFYSPRPLGDGQGEGSILRRIRIRIPNNRRTEQYKLPYYLVPGSSMDTFITAPGSKAFVVTEAELDAILIHQHAGDLTGAMAMGNSTAKPTDHAFALLQKSLHISNALDYDAEYLADGSYKNPGGVGWLWWKKHFPQAERWPVAVGKDPGDMFKAGISVREWVKTGLPPVMTLPPAPAMRPASQPQASTQDNSGAVISAATPEREKAAVYALTAADGRAFYVTDDQTEYARLTAENAIVFSTSEIQLVKQSGADKENARRFLDIKQLFPGIKVSEVGPVPVEVKQEYKGKFYHAK